MRCHPTTRAYPVIVGTLGCVLLAACAAPDGDGDVSPPAAGRPVDAAAGPTVTVPDLLGRDATTIDKTVSEAGVVLITEHIAAATEKSGTIVKVDPAAGTPVPLGSTITVAVAGPAGATLDDLVAADRRTFVGLGVDPDGTLVPGGGPGCRRHRGATPTRTSTRRPSAPGGAMHEHVRGARPDRG